MTNNKLKPGDKVKFLISTLTSTVDINGNGVVKEMDLEGILLDFDMNGNPIVRFLNPVDNKSEIRVFQPNEITSC